MDEYIVPRTRTPRTPEVSRRRPTLVLATVVAVAIIATSVWYTQFYRSTTPELLPDPTGTASLLSSVRPLQTGDHVRGNPSAALVFVVYSDFACPFCKEFHKTMTQLMDRYGREGNVAWVFRQMPLVQLHPQANVYALASECVAEAGGNKSFWKFSDLLFEKMQPEVDIGAAGLIALAQESGIPADSFTTCMQSGELQKRIVTDFDEARAAGSEGSPYTVVLAGGKRVSFSGLRPLSVMSEVTETSLQSLGVTRLENPESGQSASDQFSRDLQRMPQVDTAPPLSTSSAAVQP